MAVYYVYANVDVAPPIVSLAKSDPPFTGGVVFWKIETDESDPNKRSQLVESLAPPFRVETDKGESVATPRPATASGLDEALMEAAALAKVNRSRPLRLVAGDGVVLRRWN